MLPRALWKTAEKSPKLALNGNRFTVQIAKLLKQRNIPAAAELCEDHPHAIDSHELSILVTGLCRDDSQRAINLLERNLDRLNGRDLTPRILSLMLKERRISLAERMLHEALAACTVYDVQRVAELYHTIIEYHAKRRVLHKAVDYYIESCATTRPLLKTVICIATLVSTRLCPLVARDYLVSQVDSLGYTWQMELWLCLFGMAIQHSLDPRNFLSSIDGFTDELLYNVQIRYYKIQYANTKQPDNVVHAEAALVGLMQCQSRLDGQVKKDMIELYEQSGMSDRATALKSVD